MTAVVITKFELTSEANDMADSSNSMATTYSTEFSEDDVDQDEEEEEEDDDDIPLQSDIRMGSSRDSNMNGEDGDSPIPSGAKKKGLSNGLLLQMFGSVALLNLSENG